MPDKLKSQSKSSKEINDYLETLSIENRQICKRLRSLIIECMPGAIEIIVHGALAYATTPSSRHRIVYIAPQKDRVNLGLFFGSDIPDPSGLLQGEGKRMRHIKIHKEEEIYNPAIASILQTSWNKATHDLEKVSKKK